MSRESPDPRIRARASGTSLQEIPEASALTASGRSLHEIPETSAPTSPQPVLSRGQRPIEDSSEEPLTTTTMDYRGSELLNHGRDQTKGASVPGNRQRFFSWEQTGYQPQHDEEEGENERIPNRRQIDNGEFEESGSRLMQTESTYLSDRMSDADKMFKQMRKIIRDDGNIDHYLENVITKAENNIRNQDYPRVSRGPRERAKAIALEALKQKDLNHGHNLLMYAAYEGALTSFTSLIKVVGKKVGFETLSKQLRDYDAFGAPLLLLAASSSNLGCLRAVTKAVCRTLGLGELRLQLLAKDVKNRTILFYAAASKMVNVFDEVVSMLKQDVAYRSAEDAEDYSWLTVKEGTELLKGNEIQEIEGKIVSLDYRGMNVLHHACQGGSANVLQEILNEASRLGEKFVNAYLRTSDTRGRTALMHVLRAYDKPREDVFISNIIKKERKYGDKSEMKRKETSRKLKLLMQRITKEEDPGLSAWPILTSPVLPINASSDTNISSSARSNGRSRSEARSASDAESREQTDKGNKTPLMLAACGGFDTMVIFLKMLFKVAPRDDDKLRKDGGLDLDRCLGTPDVSSMEIKECWRGKFLAEAANSGDERVLEYVLSAIQTGVLYSDDYPKKVCDDGIDILKNAINSVTDEKGTLFTLVISSQSIGGVNFMIRLFEGLFEPEERWHLLAGSETKINNLTVTASIPLSEDSTSQPTEMFQTVYKALKQAAKEFEPDGHETLLRELLFPANETNDVENRTPLGGATLSSNVKLLKEVLDIYEELAETEDRTRWKVLIQIPFENAPGKKDTDILYSRATSEMPINISPRMLFSILKMIQDAPPTKNKTFQLQEKKLTAECMKRVVQLAAERGAFHQFRAVANGDEQLLLLEAIPSLLERIGEDEDNVIEAIMAAVKYARNCFLAGAWALSCIEDARTDFRIHKNGLDRLEVQIDVLSQAVLEALPHTLHGVGNAYAAHEHAIDKIEHDYLSRNLGFIITQWMLEPETVPEAAKKDQRNEDTASEESKGQRNEDTVSEESKSPERINPLEHALRRGSAALNFINSPLVLDYVSMKFSRSLPVWNRDNPFAFSVDKKYFNYTKRDTYVDPESQSAGEETDRDDLLRFLQGWEKGDETGKVEPRLRGIPHTTLLPGLQFILAGIAGRPTSFYEVPAIRFTYELLSYTVMIVLFGMSVTIEEPDVIPNAEIVFYIFIAGLLRREFLEVQEIIPGRRSFDVNQDPSARLKSPVKWIVSILLRYLFQDAWNILDTATIFTVTAALIFRLIAFIEFPRSDESTSFFMAQVLLAASTPLLFARVLSLSQIDSTLGPMTQIIWTMLSHLAQFSVFILVLIISFALTFYILLSECIADAENQAYEVDEVDKAFGTFPNAMLSMFKAMLGDFDFDNFSQCNQQPLAAEAAIGLLVIYLAIVAILLLNLLIAILSTVHAEVYQNAEKEFNLSRAKLIQHSCRSVSNGRQPTPINLIALIAGIVVDFFGAVWYFIYHYSFRAHKKNIPFYQPVSETDTWKTSMEMIHQLIFAVIMGPAAFFLFAILWIVSLPWIAWCFLRSRPPIDDQEPQSTRGSPTLWKISVRENIEKLWRVVMFPCTDFWKDIDKLWNKGYFGPIIAAVFLGFGWIFSLVFAIIVSAYCIIISVALLWYGIMDIVTRWWRKTGLFNYCRGGEIAEDMNQSPLATRYETTEGMVSRLNGYTNKGSKHFGVEHMLKMTTVLDVEDIWLRTQRPQARTTGESELLKLALRHEDERKNLPLNLGYTLQPTLFGPSSFSNPDG